MKMACTVYLALKNSLLFINSFNFSPTTKTVMVATTIFVRNNIPAIGLELHSLFISFAWCCG